MAQVSTVPVVRHLPFDPADLTSADLTSAAQPGPRRGAILVVEDRDDVRQGLAQLLELHGYLVFDAPNGQHALNLLREEPDGFALILLDLILTGPLSGQDVRDRQLADAQLSTIPTIIVSACEPNRHREALLRPSAWLEKPFRFDALLAVVRRFVTPERDALGVD